MLPLRVNKTEVHVHLAANFRTRTTGAISPWQMCMCVIFKGFSWLQLQIAIILTIIGTFPCKLCCNNLILDLNLNILPHHMF